MFAHRISDRDRHTKTEPTPAVSYNAPRVVSRAPRVSAEIAFARSMLGNPDLREEVGSGQSRIVRADGTPVSPWYRGLHILELWYPAATDWETTRRSMLVMNDPKGCSVLVADPSKQFQPAASFGELKVFELGPFKILVGVSEDVKVVGRETPGTIRLITCPPSREQAIKSGHWFAIVHPDTGRCLTTTPSILFDRQSHEIIAGEARAKSTVNAVVAGIFATSAVLGAAAGWGGVIAGTLMAGAALGLAFGGNTPIARWVMSRAVPLRSLLERHDSGS